MRRAAKPVARWTAREPAPCSLPSLEGVVREAAQRVEQASKVIQEDLYRLRQTSQYLQVLKSASSVSTTSSHTQTVGSTASNTCSANVSTRSKGTAAWTPKGGRSCTDVRDARKYMPSALQQGAQTRSAKFWRMRGALVAKARSLQSRLGERKQELTLPARSGANVCILFNGIGAFLESLKRVNMPLNAVHVNDWDDDAMQVTKKNFPFVSSDTSPRDAMDITEAHIVAMSPLDLFFASPPCTDLSPVKVDKRKGVDLRKGFGGPTGGLFRKTIDIWGWVKKHNPNVKFIIENVVFKDMPEWEEACTAFGGQPAELNAAHYSYTWRRRAYWNNFDVPDGWEVPLDNPGHVDHVLEDGRIMVNDHATTITASWLNNKGTDDSPFEWTRAPIKVRNLDGTESFLRPTEAEVLMGLPRDFTSLPGVGARKRLHMMGNCIDVHTLTHLMRHARLGPVHAEEVKVRNAWDGMWAAPIEERVGDKLTLDAAAMVQWLTPGACPSAEFTDDWLEACCHPTVETDYEEWASGAGLRYEGDRSTDVSAPNCASCYTATAEMRETIWDGVNKGHILGPYPKPPLAGLKTTPRALIDEMAKSGKYRPISSNNLPEGQAVNESIPGSPEPICLTGAAVGGGLCAASALVRGGAEACCVDGAEEEACAHKVHTEDRVRLTLVGGGSGLWCGESGCVVVADTPRGGALLQR